MQNSYWIQIDIKTTTAKLEIMWLELVDGLEFRKLNISLRVERKRKEQEEFKKLLNWLCLKWRIINHVRH